MSKYKGMATPPMPLTYCITRARIKPSTNSKSPALANSLANQSLGRPSLPPYATTVTSERWDQTRVRKRSLSRCFITMIHDLCWSTGKLLPTPRSMSFPRVRPAFKCLLLTCICNVKSTIHSMLSALTRSSTLRLLNRSFDHLPTDQKLSPRTKLPAHSPWRIGKGVNPRHNRSEHKKASHEGLLLQDNKKNNNNHTPKRSCRETITQTASRTQTRRTGSNLEATINGGGTALSQ
jgi:hypothetical protein